MNKKNTKRPTAQLLAENTDPEQLGVFRKKLHLGNRAEGSGYCPPSGMYDESYTVSFRWLKKRIKKVRQIARKTGTEVGITSIYWD